MQFADLAVAAQLDRDQRLATPSGIRYSEGSMPPEAHLDIFRDTAGVRPDPGLIRVEDYPDLPRPVNSLVTGLPAIIKTTAVASHE